MIFITVLPSKEITKKDFKIILGSHLVFCGHQAMEPEPFYFDRIRYTLTVVTASERTRQRRVQINKWSNNIFRGWGRGKGVRLDLRSGARFPAWLAKLTTS